MNYNFNINIAKEYGVNEAILINNFIFWIAKNKANGKNQHDGRTWTYNSRRALQTLFPFWSDSQIKTVLKNLIKKGVLMTGNYNKAAYDRTLWYAFVSENKFLDYDGYHNSIGQNSPMEETKSTNQLSNNDQPIPDINTDNKHSSKTIYIDLFNHWLSFKNLIQHQELKGHMEKSIKKALKEYSDCEIIGAIKNYSEVLADKDSYFTHRWSIDEFLSRGLKSFTDENEPLKKYSKNQTKKPTGSLPRNAKGEVDFGYNFEGE